MKRLIAGFLSVCVAVSLLMTGCSSGGTGNVSQTDASVTITIWHDKEDEVAQALQAELDTLAPDIVVKLEKKDGLTDSLKMVGNDPKSAPDMYFFAHDKIGVSGSFRDSIMQEVVCIQFPKIDLLHYVPPFRFTG